MSAEVLPADVVKAVQCARGKLAIDVRVIDLRAVASFTDYFVVSSGSNARQVQAIADAVVEGLKAADRRPASVEGHAQGEWVLLDYGDFVVHVFSPIKREFYDLERLWRDGSVVPVPEAAA